MDIHMLQERDNGCTAPIRGGEHPLGQKKNYLRPVWLFVPVGLVGSTRVCLV
jgi:hypothetical protein